MGFRKKPRPPTSIQVEERQSSWTSWVPTLGLGAGVKDEGVTTTEGSTSSRWPSFGLGSLGMGTVFGGTGQTPEDKTQSEGGESAMPALAGGVKKRETETASIASSHMVEQSEVVLPDLQAAVDADAEIELVWDKKDIWLESASGEGIYEKRRLTWIIVCPPPAVYLR